MDGLRLGNFWVRIPGRGSRHAHQEENSADRWFGLLRSKSDQMWQSAWDSRTPRDLLWPGTKGGGLEPLALLTTSFWEQRDLLASMGLGVRHQCWPEPCLTAGPAMPPLPSPWGLFLGQAGAIFGIGLGLWGWAARMTRRPGGHGILHLRFLSCVSSGKEGHPLGNVRTSPREHRGALLWPRLGVEGHPSPLHPRQAA